MNYVMIRSDIFFFILDFISCIVFLIFLAIILSKKESQKKKEFQEKFFNQIASNLDINKLVDDEKDE